MEQEFNIISTSALEKDVNLISDKNGIAISEKAFLVKEFLNTTNRPYFVEEIALIFVRNGSAGIRINLDEIFISENSIIILTPNYIVEMLEYTEKLETEKLEVDILMFNYDIVADLPITKDIGNIVEKFNKLPSINLSIKDFRELSAIHEILVYHCNKHGTLQTEITKNILYALCNLIVQFYEERITVSTKSKNRAEIIYKDFFSLLVLHYKENRSLEFYSDKLNITSKYFSKIIKETSKKNASELIDEMVIMGIKASLKCTDKTVLQISEEFNFVNASFFGTYFKKKTGVTPSQYRKM